MGQMGQMGQMGPMGQMGQMGQMVNPMMGGIQMVGLPNGSGPFLQGYGGMGMPAQMQIPMNGMGITTTVPVIQATPQQLPNLMQTNQQPVQPTTGKNSNKDLKWLKDNLKNFKGYPLAEQKNILGNIMYSKVVDNCRERSLVPKITGMLIDLEVLSIEEIIEILDNKSLLLERIEEAQKIIEEEGQQ